MTPEQIAMTLEDKRRGKAEVARILLDLALNRKIIKATQEEIEHWKSKL